MRKTLILTLTAGLILMYPSFVFAENASPSATTGTTKRDELKKEISADRISMVKSKADAEITRRISSINELITKIGGLKRLSDSDKTNLVNIANSMISNLNSLKTKIDADSDIATLRADQKSIFDQYRVYMLFMPQLRIYVAADRIDDSADLMTQVATKLQGRINGNATLQNTLNDANSKISDAKTQAANAINAIKNLQPDNGDNGVMSTNKQALLSAKNMIMAGTTDLQNARKDFVTIFNALKKENPSPSPTATP